MPDVVAWAESMVEPLRDRAREADQLRQLPDATVEEAAAAGFFRTMMPTELGGSQADIGLAFGVFAIGMLLVRPIAGYLLDKVGRRPVMLGGSLSVAVLQLLHVPAADTGELWVLLVVRVLTGAASSAMYLS